MCIQSAVQMLIPPTDSSKTGEANKYKSSDACLHITVVLFFFYIGIEEICQKAGGEDQKVKMEPFYPC